MPCKSPFGYLEGPVLVSACLLGINCRYDGKAKPCKGILSSKNFTPVPVCPERLGGLPTPRPTACFVSGDGRDVLKERARIVNADGVNVTGSFINGAMHVLELAYVLNISRAVFKEGSPSCGTNQVRSQEGRIQGVGVTAALLLENGILVMNEQGEPSIAFSSMK